MSMRYKGGFLSTDTPITTSSNAIGSWTLRNQFQVMGGMAAIPTGNNYAPGNFNGNPTPTFGTSAGEYIEAIAVNNSGVFVAMGYNATNNAPAYIKSTNGINWGNVGYISGHKGTFTSITSNSSGVFVAVGYRYVDTTPGHTSDHYGYYARSTDGSTWTTYTEAFLSTLHGVCINSSGVFVAVGYKSDISNNFWPFYARSTDGSTWTNYIDTNNSPIIMFDVAVSSSDLFVAIGKRYSINAEYGFYEDYNGVYATSTDGITWTTPAEFPTDGPYGRAFIPNKIAVNSSGVFVAIGGIINQITKLYSTSTNGLTWSTPASLPGTYSAIPRYTAITAINKGFFIVCGAIDIGSTPLAVYTTSTDGITWTSLNRLPENIGGDVSDICANNSGLCVRVPYFQYMQAIVNNYFIWNSPTNITGSSANTQMQGVTVNSSGLFVAVGHKSTNYYGYYSTSTNGSTWSTPALFPGSPSTFVTRAVTVNSSGLFVALGFDNSTYFSKYVTSTNGSTWSTPALLPGSVNFQPKAVTVNSSGLFVAVGHNGARPMYATSTNGSTWSTPALIGSTPDTKVFSICVNNSGLCVAVGYNNPSFGVYNPVYVTSTNGSTWSTASTTITSNSTFYSTSSRLYSVAVNSSGVFVAVGKGGYTTSTNGSTWTALTDFPSYVTDMGSMTNVCVNSSGLFVAVGGRSFNETDLGASGTTSLDSNSNGQGYYSISTNGSTWSKPVWIAGEYNPAFRVNGIAVSPSGVYACVGADYSEYPTYASTKEINSNIAQWPTAKRPPDPPTIGTVTAYGRNVNISFTAPFSDGNLPIISYTANSSIGNSSNTIFQSGNGSIIISGLTGNTSHTFTMYDTNAVGRSVNSNISNAVMVRYFNEPTIFPYSTANNMYDRMRAVINTGGSNFSAVGTKYSTSADGNTWLELSSFPVVSPIGNNASSGLEFFAIAANTKSGLLVAVGGQSGYPIYSYSTNNGSTWSGARIMNTTNTLSGASGVMYAIAHKPGLFVAVGANTGGYALINTSTNGTSWSSPGSIANTVTQITLNGIAYRESDGLFVTCGKYGNNDVPAPYFTSTDGFVWGNPKLVSNMRYINGIICSSSGLFMAVGANTGGYPAITTSTNGVVWSSPIVVEGIGGTISGSTCRFDAIYQTKNGFTVVGATQNANGNPIYAFSTDGITWSGLGICSSVGSLVAVAQANTSDLCVAVGYTGTNYYPTYATTAQ